MNDATQRIPQEPDLADIAFEAEQQAARIRALVQALAEAHEDTDVELQFECIDRLLDPLCAWTSTLSSELHHRAPTDEPGAEPRP